MIQLIIITFITIVSGLFLQKSSKYITFSYNQNTLQVSTLVVVGIILIISFTYVWLLKFAFKTWLKTRKLLNSLKKLKSAGLHLIAKQALPAEKLALKCKDLKELSWLSLLLAAKAAQQRSAWDQAGQYLLEAEGPLTTATKMLAKVAPYSKIAVGLLKAENYYAQRAFSKCINTLIELYNAEHSKPILIKLAKVLQSLNAEKLAELENIKLITTFFSSLPKKIKYQQLVIHAYLKCLMQGKDHVTIEKIISTYFKDPSKHQDGSLLKLYGVLEGDPLLQLKTAEQWLKADPVNPNPALLLTLGRLCLKNNLLGKARDYLEKSLNIEADPECYAELGRLNEILGETKQSLEFYQKGLLTVVK